MHNSSVPDNTPFAAEVAVMREMHWSWAELAATPADVVDAVLERMIAEDHWRTQAAKRAAAKRKAD